MFEVGMDGGGGPAPMGFEILKGDVIIDSPGHPRPSEGMKPIVGRVELQ